jgi:hypothetical protein
MGLSPIFLSMQKGFHRGQSLIVPVRQAICAGARSAEAKLLVSEHKGDAVPGFPGTALYLKWFTATSKLGRARRSL